MLLRREGERSGISRIHRLYREEEGGSRSASAVSAGRPAASACRPWLRPAQRALVARLRVRLVRQWSRFRIVNNVVDDVSSKALGYCLHFNLAGG